MLLRLFVLLFFLYLGNFLAFAQLQDSHFYKVDSSEISSNFKVDNSWKTEVEGSFFSRPENRERLMKFKLFAKLDVEMFSSFGVEFEPYIVLQEGETQSRFVAIEARPIQMRKGFFYYRPIDGLSLQLGAINQDFLSAPLLFKDQTFLSSLVAYAYIKEKYEIQSIFQFGMPSINNTFKRYNEIEDIGYFSSLFTYGEWLPSDLYSFKGHVTGFLFSENLPYSIVEKSLSYGNSISGTGTSARFLYPFYGINTDVSTQLKLSSSLFLSFGYNMLMNFGTLWDKGFGERIYTILDMDFWKQVKLYSRFEYFNNGSDSAPAYFNSEIYGHNNRKGFLAELKSFLPRGNLELGLRYVLSVPVHINTLIDSPDKQHALSAFIRTRYFSI